MNLEFLNNPASQDLDYLTKQINQETPEFGTAHPFAFFIRDENSQIVAGCNGSVIYGAIYTDQLWVHPNHRKQGLAQSLMNKVHAYGREQGCRMATVATMSFQDAQRFYEKLGYLVDFTRTGYVKDSSCLFMIRKL